MSNKLKAITTRAKKLYKTGRYKLWTDAIKAASKQVAKPAKKVSGVKKKGAKKVARKASHVDKKSHKVRINVVSGLNSEVVSNSKRGIDLAEKRIRESLKIIDRVKLDKTKSLNERSRIIQIQRESISRMKKEILNLTKQINSLYR